MTGLMMGEACVMRGSVVLSTGHSIHVLITHERAERDSQLRVAKLHHIVR